MTCIILRGIQTALPSKTRWLRQSRWEGRCAAEPCNEFLNNSAVVVGWKDDADRFYGRDHRELPVVRVIELDFHL